MDKFGQSAAGAARAAAGGLSGSGGGAGTIAPGNAVVDASSFRPPPGLRGPHAQTIWPNYLLRRPAAGRALASAALPTDIGTADGDRLRLHWSEHRDHGPVLIVLHGLTGCSSSDNVVSVAAKGFDRGFDVVRVDLRNSQGEHPSLSIGHAGRSEDLRAVIDHVRARRPGFPIAVLGFSLGGNVALKTMGEYGVGPPDELRATATISVPIDLDQACSAIDRRDNWIYRTYFLRRLKGRYRELRSRHPDHFPPIDVASVRTIRGWDNAVVAPLAGFRDAEDYYARSSAKRVIADNRVPTLLIQSEDDPFIPFHPFRDPAVVEHRPLTLLAPCRGGHVGFYAASSGADPDRFWAENRALDFCAAAAGLGGSPATPGRPGA